LDGTSLVYSHRLCPAEAAGGTRGNEAFRILVEPGGVGISVAQQVDFSLATADSIVQCLGWQSATPDLNGIIARVFPRNAADLEDWWGGIWLGMESAGQTFQFRLYLNLRHGTAQGRWQRIADVLGFLGGDDLEGPLKALVAQTVPLAIPVGLGVVVQEGRVSALRLYAGLHRPNRATLIRMLGCEGELDGDASRLAAGVCGAFEDVLGGFRNQSVTAGYDFIVGGGAVIEPRVARAKLDISCQSCPQQRRPQLRAELRRTAVALRQDPDSLDEFFADLSECFGGAAVEYVSFFLAGDDRGLTVYAKPDGFALG
jgi:hypothetical protein